METDLGLENVSIRLQGIEVLRFKALLRDEKYMSQFKSTMDMLKVYVGMDRQPPKTVTTFYVSKFFPTLKKHAFGKWQKAVKEFAKAVL